MAGVKYFIKDTTGGAVVEATVLFPIMIMIFAALVMLSMYLPTRATLQHATQYAATAMATEQSDTWIFYDGDAMQYYWEGSKDDLDNVYAAFFKSIAGKGTPGKAETIVRKIEENSISVTTGTLTVDCRIQNYIVYKEIVVTATRVIPVAIDLSFVGFPTEIPVTVTSTTVVQNGDEFIRNMDIAVNFVEYIDGKYNLSEVFQNVKKLSDTFSDFLGWK